MPNLEYLSRGVRFPADLDAATAAIRDQIVDAATDEGGIEGTKRSPVGTDDVVAGDDGAVLVRWEAVLRLVTPVPPALPLGDADDFPDASEEQLSLTPNQLGLPLIDQGVTPYLTHVGSPLDSAFEVELREWRHHGQRVEVHQVHENTPWIRVNGTHEVLLSEACWHLMREMQIMRSRPAPARTTEHNWRHWAVVRDAAVRANADLDTFLQNTRVLLPKHLRLLVDEEGSGADRELTIHPHFDGAPPEWLSQFERRAISGVYRVPSGQEYYEIIVADEVQVALAAMKDIPGRKLRGATAQRFIANPMAALGPDIGSVLDAEDVQRVYSELRRNACRFEPLIEAGQPPRIHVLVEPLEKRDDEQVATVLEELGSPAMVLSFCSRIESALADGLEQFSWRGHELTTDGSSTLYAQQLRAAHDAWIGQPTAGQEDADAHGEAGRTSDTLLDGDLSAIDLSRYYERIEGVGYETPYAIARIPRPKELGGWLPEEIALSFAPIAAPDAATNLTLAQVADFEDATDAASQAGAPEVDLPDGTTLPIDEAKALIDTTPNEVLDTARAATGRAPKSREPEKPKASLLIAPNIDTADYVEQRALAFALPDGASARLPAGLRAETTLKPHQLDGVAWMQHLRSFGENACRGALLADDMGLGKTLQLLTFIVEELERDPTCSPALVVAPVTLLENWEKEIDRFFLSAPPLRTLYGTAVRNLRANPGDVDPNLRATGRSILRDDWLGDARIVLTTYETVRDLQFSIAEQDWSIVVCDEAQKIKNPNALWTRAVKKLKAEFRIAATGTPVENSIQDIWSIFDFIQPGLLDPLNVFSRKYRRPIESKTEDERNRVEELREILHPQILRRTKEEVAKDLPNKIIDTACLDLAMAPGQVALYEEEVQRITGGSYGSSQEFAIEMLNALRFFRHLCVDPSPRGQQATAELPLKQYRTVSPKFDWLIQQLDAIRGLDEKAIIFVEMRDVQRQLKQYLEERYALNVAMINGETSTALGSPNSRQRLIDIFQDHPGFNVIILSPLAAGVGLNIQQANHVIHYVRHWNPAREDQATDRAYRIGQTRDVTVYTPTVRGPGWMSFEETLDRLLAIKRQLAGDMLDGVDDVERELMRDFASQQGIAAVSE